MKSLKITTLTILLCTVFTSCDAIDELTEFDANFTLSESVLVSIEENEENTQSFTQSISLNLAENGDVADNLNALESVEITSLSYTFTGVTGNEEAEITNAQLTVGNVSIQIDPVNPTLAMGQELTVQDTAGLNALASALLANPQTTVTLQGAVDGNPITFTLNLEVDVEVTIDPV